MSLALLIASCLAAVLVAFASWYKDRAKDGQNVKVLRASNLGVICSVLVVVLAGSNQYSSSKQSAALRSAQLQLSVLQDLSRYRVEMVDTYIWLLLHSTVIYNFVGYEQAREGIAAPIPHWETVASEPLRQELKEAKSTFERLQKIAREVLMQAATYPTAVPEPLTEWATTTLSLHFNNLPQVINGYSNTAESQKYAELIGRAVGAVTGQAAIKALQVSQ
jgi:hypothetical protein